MRTVLRCPIGPATFPCPRRCGIRDASPNSDFQLFAAIDTLMLKEVDHDPASFRISPAQDSS